MSGLDSILDEERFLKRLKKLAETPKSERKKKLQNIDDREKRRAEDHRIMNEYIMMRRQFMDEWRREDPDGEREGNDE